MYLTHTPAHGRLWRACAEVLEDRRLLSAGLVKDINTGTQDSSPWMIGTAGSLVYFQAGNQASGVSVYQSDGTDAGTEAIHANWPSNQRPTAVIQTAPGKIFFPFFSQLWATTDGMAGDAQFVKQFTTTRTSAHSFVAAGGKLYFIAAGDSDPNNNELWVSDGTAAGTVQLTHQPGDVVSLAAVGSKSFLRPSMITSFRPWARCSLPMGRSPAR